MAPNKRILTVQLISAIALIIVGVGLLIAGFILPPQGVIDASVLTAFGEILTFVGALFGIDYHYRYRVFDQKKEDTTNTTNQ